MKLDPFGEQLVQAMAASLALHNHMAKQKDGSTAALVRKLDEKLAQVCLNYCSEHGIGKRQFGRAVQACMKERENGGPQHQ